jgi:hypothetical protein
LLRFAGCAATWDELAAALISNDVLMRSRSDLTDTSHPLEALWFLTGAWARFRAPADAGARRGGIPRLRPRGPSGCEVGADLPAEVAGPD